VTTVRPTAVAGFFYPDQPERLAAMVDSMLDAAGQPDGAPTDTPDDELPVALIAPHAGYVYSGPVAASAYARLRRWRADVRRVVVIGPPHRVPVHGLALSSADEWETPLGRIPVDTAACEQLLAKPGVRVDDHAHAAEHSLEVHLPFLQRVLDPGWTLVPVIAGGPAATALADALEPVWAAPNTVVVVSTDLSHYHPQWVARPLDRATAELIVDRQWERLDGDRACGASGVRAALELARRHHEHVELVDLRDSGDTAGPLDRVVGYGSFLVR
jgi:AmmeMemoRadiSam system protein B